MDTADELVARVFERPRAPAAPVRLPEGPADPPGRDGGADPELAGPDFSGPYQAFARAQPFPLRCLILYFNAEERRKFGKRKVQVRYEHLDSDDPAGEGFAADGRSFAFVVAGGRQAQRVTVRGRNLERGYDLIMAQQVGWLRSGDRDGGPDEEPFIEAVAIEPVPDEE